MAKTKVFVGPKPAPPPNQKSKPKPAKGDAKVSKGRWP